MIKDLFVVVGLWGIMYVPFRFPLNVGRSGQRHFLTPCVRIPDVSFEDLNRAGDALTLGRVSSPSRLQPMANSSHC